MMDQLGPDYSDFHNSLYRPAPVSVRHNPGKINNFFGDPVPWCLHGRYLQERPVFTLDPKLHAGAFYVQEASSMFVEQAVRQSTDLSKSLNVLDLCAAPGGKSTHLLSLLSKDSLLISNEVIRSRATILSENIQKWGHDNVIVTHSDPSNFGRMPGFFDLILLDAPCSGEGLFRKEPGAMREWSLPNVDHCSVRQKRILSDVWPALKPGGILIYSTCTYNEKENIENISWHHSKNNAESIKLSLEKTWGISTTEKGDCIGYQLFPHRVNGEGFFISVLKKTEGSSPSKSRLKDTLHYPTKDQINGLCPWISGPASQCFFLHHETIRMIPGMRVNELQYALNHLNVLVAGTAVAEITKNKLVPDHALALSQKLLKENIHRISVNREEALDYLRKNSTNLPTTQLGFALIEFEGLGLGWVNVLQNRYNNLYPANWRVKNL